MQREQATHVCIIHLHYQQLRGAHCDRAARLERLMCAMRLDRYVLQQARVGAASAHACIVFAVRVGGWHSMSMGAGHGSQKKRRGSRFGCTLWPCAPASSWAKYSTALPISLRAAANWFCAHVWEEQAAMQPQMHAGQCMQARGGQQGTHSSMLATMSAADGPSSSAAASSSASGAAACCFPPFLPPV